MARQLTTNWDDGTVQGWTGVDAYGAGQTYWWKVNNALPYVGAYGLQTWSGAGNGSAIDKAHSPALPLEGYLRFYYRFSALPLNASTILRLSSVTSYNWCRLNISGTNDANPGELHFDRNVSGSSGASNVLSANTWYAIEVYYRGGSVTGQQTLRINGATWIDVTGDTTTGAYNHTSTTLQSLTDPTYIDEFAINDTTGGSDNSWLGEIATGRHVITAGVPFTVNRATFGRGW